MIAANPEKFTTKVFYVRDVNKISFVNYLQSLESTKSVIIGVEELYYYAKDSSNDR